VPHVLRRQRAAAQLSASDRGCAVGVVAVAAELGGVPCPLQLRHSAPPHPPTPPLAGILPRKDQPVCEPCFLAAADRCTTCGEAILGKHLKALGRKYHPAGCLACAACQRRFGTAERMFQRDGWPVCEEHARGPLPPDAEKRMRGGPGPGAGGAASGGGPGPA